MPAHRDSSTRSIFTIGDRRARPTRLLANQVSPNRVSLRKPVNVGLMADLAAAEFGASVPMYLDQPFSWDPQQRLELDYVMLAELVESFSAAFYEVGVRQWDRVAIVKSSNYDVQSVAWAAARIGAIPALISAQLTPDIINILLDRVQPVAIVTDAETAQRLNLTPARAKALGARVIAAVDGGIPIEDLLGARVPGANPLKDDEPMMITHTSSTTGVSKLGETSAKAVTFSALREAIFPGVHGAGELFASAISHVHVRGAITQMASMSRGTPVLGIARHDRDTIAELLTRYRPTILESHPNAFIDWETLAGQPDNPFASVRVFFNTFDAIHPRSIRTMLEASQRKFPVWLQCYGMTEVQVVTVRPYTRGMLKNSELDNTRSVGWEVPGVRARIADPATGKRSRDQHEPGMIQVKTPAQVLSFVGTPAKFAERRHGRWFDTGDWGRRGTRGQLEVLDRVADRIEGVDSCLRIEDVLLAKIPGAEEVVVVSDGNGGAVPVVCMRPGTRLHESEWAAAAAEFPNLGAPVEVTPDDLQRTATVKARRFLLTEMIKNGGAEASSVDRTLMLRDGA